MWGSRKTSWDDSANKKTILSKPTWTNEWGRWSDTLAGEQSSAGVLVRDQDLEKFRQILYIYFKFILHKRSEWMSEANI